MINLLKSKKVTEKGINADIEKNGQTNGEALPQPLLQNVEEKIGRYKDPDGLTVSKLNLGLWWVQNRPKMIKMGVLILIAVSIVTWSLFIFTFGYYVFFGIKQDRLMIEEMISGSAINPDIIASMSAKDLRFQEVRALKVLEDRYDFLAAVTNPNEKFYAEFDYYFVGDGKETAKRQGFILPNEGKYVFCLGQEFKFLPNEVEFRIENVKWTRIDYKNFPNWQHFSQERLNIKADGAQFSSAKSTVLTEKLDLNELKFAIHNRTIFNYWNVNLKILLFSRGQIVSVNEYAVKNLMADESRHVAMTWPGRFSLVDKIEIMPEINITKKDIYINYEGGIGSLK